MVAFSAFYESHKPPPSGDARGIVPLHCDGYQNNQQKGYMCSIIVGLIVALVAAGAIQS